MASATATAALPKPPVAPLTSEDFTGLEIDRQQSAIWNQKAAQCAPTPRIVSGDGADARHVFRRHHHLFGKAAIAKVLLQLEAAFAARTQREKCDVR